MVERTPSLRQMCRAPVRPRLLIARGANAALTCRDDDGVGKAAWTTTMRGPCGGGTPESIIKKFLQAQNFRNKVHFQRGVQEWERHLRSLHACIFLTYYCTRDKMKRSSQNSRAHLLTNDSDG
ncbi:hypothetical protein J2129_001092 [Methanofollis sp. W23]|nr:hypothetical protein [Methanofollis sp. W23]